MHANLSQLIARRDREPLDADIAAHLDACDTCRQALAGLHAMQGLLRALPRIEPPEETWAAIVSRRELETAGAATHRAPLRHVAMLGAFSVALLVASVSLRLEREPDVEVTAAGSSTRDLQQRSRELEYLLRRYESPAVMSLSTAGAISELEDSIALIDYQLNAASNDARENALWSQRVTLMETLVTVRAAESYLDSI